MNPTVEYWDRIADRRFSFCCCSACDHTWLPPSAECPRCLQPQASLKQASGAATLLSWVVFHRAYHDSVKDRIPYVVGLLRLVEGPQLVANVPVGAALREGMAMRLCYDGEGDTMRPGFVPADQVTA